VTRFIVKLIIYYFINRVQIGVERIKREIVVMFILSKQVKIVKIVPDRVFL